MADFTLQARRRTIFIIGSLLLLAIALLVRMIDLQIFQRPFLVAQAKDEIWVKIPIHARRGHIYDRRGRAVALNEKGYVLWVNAEQFEGKNPEAIALVAQSCPQQSRQVIGEIMTGNSKGFYLCSRWLDPIVAERLKAMTEDKQLKGVVVEEEPRRFYPYGELLAPVLGYLLDSGNLQASEVTTYTAHLGVEQAHDAALRGTDGWIDMERDPLNYPIPIGYREEHPPREGAQVTLTLDLNIQYKAYQLLTQAIEKSGARRGDIVVLEPGTGGILAMTSFPTFNPNDILACANQPACEKLLYVNPAIGLHYEPGSTMKILTMAIALEEHIVRTDSTFECTGEEVVGGIPFHNWNGLGHGTETMGEILLHSCNVGMVYVSQLIQPQVYYRYLSRLGFGRPTGVDLTGEAPGFMRTPDEEGWSAVDQAANAFGQAIDVTPLQLAAAALTIPNGGELLQPYIVQAVEQDGVISTTRPTLRGSIFQKETCREINKMLADVGDIMGPDGGPLIPGYRMALKTGTAQIPIPGEGGYEPHRTIASAIGYGPVEDPRFLILVRIEGNSVLWGEEVAVPVVGDLAKFLLSYMHVPPPVSGGRSGP